MLTADIIQLGLLIAAVITVFVQWHHYSSLRRQNVTLSNELTEAKAILSLRDDIMRAKEEKAQLDGEYAILYNAWNRWSENVWRSVEDKQYPEDDPKVVITPPSGLNMTVQEIPITVFEQFCVDLVSTIARWKKVGVEEVRFERADLILFAEDVRAKLNLVRQTGSSQVDLNETGIPELARKMKHLTKRLMEEQKKKIDELGFSEFILKEIDQK